MKASEKGVLVWTNPVEPGVLDLLIEPQWNRELSVGARMDAPRLKSFIRRMSHWVEHGKFPETKEPEEYLFLAAWDGERDEARDVARRLFGALSAEWAKHPASHPLLEELATEHKWLQPAPVGGSSLHPKP